MSCHLELDQELDAEINATLSRTGQSADGGRRTQSAITGSKDTVPRGGCDETLELEPTPKVIVKFEDSTARCSLPVLLSIHPWSVLVVMRNVLRVFAEGTASTEGPHQKEDTWGV